MFIFQSKFDNLPNCDRITEKSGTSKKIQWDFQISKIGSLDFLDLKVNGNPVLFQIFFLISLQTKKIVQCIQ